MSSSCIKPTKLDFLRHGEVRGLDCFRGVTDDSLTERGWHQMLQQCQGHEWQTVISSPLQRCAAFAKDWTQEKHVKLVLDPDWIEFDFGDWEGKTAEQLCPQQSQALQLFYDDPLSYTPPNAESYSQFACRVQKAWDCVLEQYPGQHILVVTHAGVIRLLFSYLLGISPKQSFQIEVPHACLSRFSCFDDKYGKFVQLNFHKPL